MAAESEVYHATITVYHNVHAAAKQNIPGAKTIYEYLKLYFTRGKKWVDEADAESERD
ncbi:MAG: hypothetical protein LBJ41_07855 [Treponema sp.]|jgi:hypothetical protein|nr:hypothetical protein [Treponema sp.]